MNNEYSKLLAHYKHYAASEEARAVYFIKENIKKSVGHWIHINFFEYCKKSDNRSHFKYVKGGLYKRELKPKYPDKSEFTSNGNFDERNYLSTVRAITWKAANDDIKLQINRKVKPIKFEVKGVYYIQIPETLFKDSAPPNIQALAENPNDRTNPLWDYAINYINRPQPTFKIKSIRLY